MVVLTAAGDAGEQCLVHADVSWHHANLVGLRGLWDVQRKLSGMQTDVVASQGGPKVRTQMRAHTWVRQSMFISLKDHGAEPSSTLGFHLIHHSFVHPRNLFRCSQSGGEQDVNEGSCATRWTGLPL